VFDNVSGIVRSSTLAGLLTNPTFQGRRLGTGRLVEAINDRLWVITGNNAVLGGDLPRRSLHVRLDPGMPNPESRTRFVIPDFEGWVREHRGELLWALLVMVRSWVANGSPIPSEVRGDSYGRWAAVVGGILANAGVPGTFDDPAATQTTDPETEEWERFLSRAYDVFGDHAWTAKSLLDMVQNPAEVMLQTTSAKPIPFEYLPDALLDGKVVLAPSTLARKLGKFLQFRQGRWFGAFSVVRGPATEGAKMAVWKIRRYGASEE
jgi:hypothetical protein